MFLVWPWGAISRKTSFTWNDISVVHLNICLPNLGKSYFATMLEARNAMEGMGWKITIRPSREKSFGKVSDSGSAEQNIEVIISLALCHLSDSLPSFLPSFLPSISIYQLSRVLVASPLAIRIRPCLITDYPRRLLVQQVLCCHKSFQSTAYRVEGQRNQNKRRLRLWRFVPWVTRPMAWQCHSAQLWSVVSISCPTRVVIFCSTVALATVAEVSIERIAKLKGNNCFT